MFSFLERVSHLGCSESTPGIVLRNPSNDVGDWNRVGHMQNKFLNSYLNSGLHHKANNDFCHCHGWEFLKNFPGFHSLLRFYQILNLYPNQSRHTSQPVVIPLWISLIILSFQSFISVHEMFLLSRPTFTSCPAFPHFAHFELNIHLPTQTFSKDHSSLKIKFYELFCGQYFLVNFLWYPLGVSTSS